MLEVTPPTQIPMFPRNYRELLLAEPAPPVAAAQRLLLAPGQVFQLAQPKWPIDSTAPSFYALAFTVFFSAFFLVAFKDIAALINYEIRSRFSVAGNPVVSFAIAMIAVTMLLISYENDIKKRSGYYSETSDPRYIVGLSLIGALFAVFWSSKVFSTNPLPPEEQAREAQRISQTQTSMKGAAIEKKGSARQLKKQAKREAKKLSVN